MRVASVSTEAWVVGGLVVLGAVLRFATLGTQSYWFDEAQAAHELHLSFGAMLSVDGRQRDRTRRCTSSLGWLWAQLFGTGEVALRSLSALPGTA